MRILHVVGGLNRGGAETWLVQVLRHIDREQFKFDFLVHSNERYAYEDEVTSLGSRVIRCLSPRNPLRYAMNFRKALKEYGPYDCVHSHIHDFGGIALALADWNDVPIRVVQSHLDTRAIDERAGAMRRFYLGAMRRLIKKYATVGTAVSEAAGDSLFPPNWRDCGGWRVDPLGIDLEPFTVAVDREAIRKSLGISEGSLVIGHVGRFQEQKNHTFLIDIAEKLVEIEPSTTFLLVGDGPLRPSIERKVAERGLSRHFIFLGVRSDIPKIMKGAMDVFVLPSLFEGLPLVLVEAQAAALPCVVSNVVSAEADTPLVSRLGLDDPPTVWATELKKTLQFRSNWNGSEGLIRNRSIAHSALNLASLYSLT